jgi:ABC-type uncharacterized transport system permease subunit
VVGATARGFVSRSNAYLIDVIRWPLFPLVFFVMMRLTYTVSGQETVAGMDPSAFLMTGMFGFILWSGTIWSSGYAVEYERSEGTAAALFLSPASRVAVIAGYGLGGFVWMAPSFVTMAILGFATGARFNVADPRAAIGAVMAMLIGSLATGFALAGLFILSRRANLLANFLQRPGELLAGALFPRDLLPGPLYALSNCLPVSHAPGQPAQRRHIARHAPRDRTHARRLGGLRADRRAQFAEGGICSKAHWRPRSLLAAANQARCASGWRRWRPPGGRCSPSGWGTVDSSATSRPGWPTRSSRSPSSR